MVMKKKLKVTTVLVVLSLLIGIIPIMTPVKAADSNRILMIDIMAQGDDGEILLLSKERLNTIRSAV
jgi:hypothetical protein